MLIKISVVISNSTSLCSMKKPCRTAQSLQGASHSLPNALGEGVEAMSKKDTLYVKYTIEWPLPRVKG